jgi:ubiquinone/menaquinone biosynthesis C-methylase UbiE
VAGGDTSRTLNLDKRVALVAKLVGSLDGKRVLDAGCGAGGYAAAYARRGARVVGVERQREKLRAADRAQSGVTLMAADLCELPLKRECCDVVVLNEVLEHVPDQRSALREAHRVLRAAGMLIVLSPNRLYPFESHGVTLHWGARPLPPYVPFVPYLPLGLGTHLFEYWARNYWPWQLQRLVRDADFEIVECGFVAQTFENISGTQPALLRWFSPLLRQCVTLAERVPGLRAVCSVSQLIAARKAS